MSKTEDGAYSDLLTLFGPKKQNVQPLVDSSPQKRQKLEIGKTEPTSAGRHFSEEIEPDDDESEGTNSEESQSENDSEESGSDNENSAEGAVAADEEMAGDGDDDEEIDPKILLEIPEEDQDDCFVKKFTNVITKKEADQFKKVRRKFSLFEYKPLQLAKNEADELVLLSDQKTVPDIRDSLEQYKVKLRLAKRWKENHPQKKRKLNSDEAVITNHLHQAVFPLINSYADVWVSFCNQNNKKFLTEACILHALNHIFKSRDRILKNNAKLSAASKVANSPELQCTDQGFSRAKVLILTPFRSSAMKIVQEILHQIPLQNKDQVMNMKRFLEEYDMKNDDEIQRKPKDYVRTFSGNNDDCFRLGISFSRKTTRIFSDFYKSDIIIASPLGLRMLVGTEKETERDLDFLSSIEVLIMDDADVFLMQNWDHVENVISAVNCMPHKPRDTDFSRLRDWYANGLASSYRQTIMLSSFLHASLNSTFRNSNNTSGQCKLRSTCSAGSITQVVTQIKQIFHKVEYNDFKDIYNARFERFKTEILPQIKASTNGHTLIFISHYFDFVILRNYFTEQNLSFGCCSEYSKSSEVSRSRAFFLDGRVQFLLVTERFHFFKRYKIRGIQNIVFYSLPLQCQFYPEFLNFIESGDNVCIALFSKHDAHELERIIGTERRQKVLTSSKQTFLFC